MDFNHGLYSSEEWTITDNEVSARFSPHNRQHRFTYTLNKGVHSRVEHVSMDLQLCTTLTAANANVRIEYMGIRDAYQLRTYPHEKRWKKRIHWQMSGRGIELLNSMGEVSVSINVYWDGHGVFQLLNLKIVPETRPGDTDLIHDEVDCDIDVGVFAYFNWGQA